jgi:dTDP-4-amino-4,6-dideoxygalactose transaminase
MFINFVENKIYDVEKIFRNLQPAINKNWHTNFGPVTQKLEQTIHKLNGNNPNNSVCCVSNATIGIQAIISTFNNISNRQLRWLVSDFGFFTNFIGPLTNHKSIACNQDGMISIQNLKKIPNKSYDAILATNIFGLKENFLSLFQFCRTNKKALLIDNAAGFLALESLHTQENKDDDLLWAEVVSFHHTKPWGVGEGGAAFLPSNLLSTFKASINFGIENGKLIPDLLNCSNGKMSELAAAAILSRVNDYNNWSQLYHYQAKRILNLGKSAGLQPFIKNLPNKAVPGQIPFLCRNPITLNELFNPYFQILKYYRPPINSSSTANFIYDRIINVPCHPDMANLNDDTIVKVLRLIQEKSK